MYTCVICLTQSSSLFHYCHSKSDSKSTKSAVKLTRCTNCQQNVDHYIEHEPLLIAMDLVLLRFPAYRHLFFNRPEFASFCIHDESTPDSVNHEHNECNQKRTGNTKKAFSYVFVSAFLDAYHKFESLQQRHLATSNDVTTFFLDNNEKSNTFDRNGKSTPALIFIHVLVWSFLEHVLFILGISLYIFYNHFGTDTLLFDKRVISRLFLAVAIPTSFRFISIFILIWENSDTVRIIGSCFVLLFQFMSIQTIMERFYFLAGAEIQNSRNFMERWIPGSCPFVFGWMLRSFIPCLIADVLSIYSDRLISQCSGYEIQIPSLMHDKDTWRALCIT